MYPSDAEFIVDIYSEFFPEYLDGMKEECFIMLVDGAIGFANKYFYEITNYKKEDILNRSIFNIVPGYHKEISEEIINNISNNSKGKTLSILTKQCSTILFEIKGRSFNKDGKKIVFINCKPTQNFIHRSKELNWDLYDCILNSISENIFIINKSLDIIDTVKVKSEKLRFVQNLSEFFSGTAIIQLKSSFNKKPKANMPVFFEIKSHKSYFEGKLTSYHENLYVISFNEISLRKRIENKLIDSQIQLKQLNNEKDILLSIIAHDLKNPFNIINGFCSVLLNTGQRFPDEKKEEILQHIFTASMSGHMLLENLLEWARSQSERIIINPVEISLEEITDHIIHFYKININNKKITLNTNIDSNHKIVADKNMLSTILRNLISNAIKFTPEKGCIDISSEMTDKKQIVVKVKDSGVGLSDKQLENLFVVGKIHSTKGTNGERGTGLGLMLCKEFVIKNKGNISVNSEKGQGAEFSVSLPIATN